MADAPKDLRCPLCDVCESHERLINARVVTPIGEAWFDICSSACLYKLELGAERITLADLAADNGGRL